MNRSIAFAIFTSAFLIAFLVNPGASHVHEKQKFLRKANPIANNYLVVLDDSVVGEKGALSIAPQVAADLASLYKGRVKHIYQHALNGFSVEMSEDDAEALSKDFRVRFVEEDGRITVNTTQNSPPWGLDRIDQRDRPLNGQYNYTSTGAGIRAYVIDTGIRTSHSQFVGRASAVFDAFGGNGQDCNGHGTHVAGTIGGTTYGVAKGVLLRAVRVLDCDGNGTDSTLIAGVDWVTSNHISPAIANISIGGGASTAVDTAVDNMISANVTTAIAAGNNYGIDACNTSPARVAAAITVGSTTATDAKSDFSDIGTCLDIFAPGSSIMSAWTTSDTATNTMSGTSMAAPHVAGVAALYLQNNAAASPSTVRDQIVNTATRNKLTGIGSGSPNRLLYSPLTTGGVPSACAGGTLYTGMLSFTGDFDHQPNGTFYFAPNSGSHKGCLVGPASGADFDLFLNKWNGTSWVIVASSESATSNETISYSGSSGYYQWQIYSYSGSGSYSFWRLAP